MFDYECTAYKQEKLNIHKCWNFKEHTVQSSFDKMKKVRLCPYDSENKKFTSKCILARREQSKSNPEW